MLFLGPVFTKELLEISRRPGYYAARMLLGTIVLVVLGVIYFQTPLEYGYGHRETARVGHNMFLGWLWVQLCVLALLTPTFVCGLIAGEKDKATLEILFTTDLKNREIVAGKLASRWMLILLILVSSMPAVVILALFGGVDYRDMLLGLALTASVTAFIGALGTYFSLITSKPWIAMLRTYMAGMVIWLMFPMVGALAVIAMTNGPNAGSGPPAFWFVMFLTQPLLDLILLTDARGAPVPIDVDSMFLFACAFWSIAAAAIFGYCCLRLRAYSRLNSLPITWRILAACGRFWRNRFRRSPTIRDTTLPAIQTDGSQRRTFADRLLDWNPMVFRNHRGNAYDNEHHLLVIQLIGMAMVVVFFTIQGMNGSGRLSSLWSFGPAIVMEMMAIHLILVVLAAGSISREMERGTLDQLLLTSIAPLDIVSGHFFGIFKAIRPSLYAVAATIFFGMLTGAFSGNWIFVGLYVGVLISITLAVAAEGLLVSAACPTVALSSSRALVAPGLQWLLGDFVSGTFPTVALQRLAFGEFAVLLLAFRGLRGDANYRRLSAMLIALLLPCSLFHVVVLSRMTVGYIDPSQGFNFMSWVSGITDDSGPFRAFNSNASARGPRWQGPFDFESYAPAFIAIHLLSTAIMLWLASGCVPRLIGLVPRRQSVESRQSRGKWRWRRQPNQSTTSAGTTPPEPTAPSN